MQLKLGLENNWVSEHNLFADKTFDLFSWLSFQFLKQSWKANTLKDYQTWLDVDVGTLVKLKDVAFKLYLNKNFYSFFC